MSSKLEEKQAQEYREFILWARIQICDSVMRYGFQNVGSEIERILHAYRQLKKEKT